MVARDGLRVYAQMSEDTRELVGILDYCDNPHLSSAFRTHHRIDFIDLHKKASPGSFARVTVNIFFAAGQRLIMQILRNSAVEAWVAGTR